MEVSIDQNNTEAAFKLKPFLKWAGGKRWLLPELRKHIPEDYKRYFEPFLGGGAVFFGVRPGKAVLSDLNSDLIQLYRAVRDEPNQLEVLLAEHHKKHDKEYYYATRASKPDSPIEKAAWMLYLNRTCFNGLYRVNKKGEFNVPIGTKSAVVYDNESFQKLSDALSNAELKSQDFENTIEGAGTDDFLYVDPPYTVAHNFNGFLKYNDHIFSWDDQVRLRNSLENAAVRGAKIVVSNANHSSIRDLYKGFGEMRELPRHSVIAGPAGKRVPTSELLYCVGVS
ncbi:Dam family site-specific DNA-(adenine-N6)-methyltransferase [Sulfitobacter sp. 20_GPM-1509m]|uniref:DNA adenine methylase n=1 Tax=Sulfitobacter sp. 20_GPM-1509m TaxID=1380367 RepID=UPI0009DCB79A|nr:Dam family site-specific DNA-(adenine-N6)-methyltransferase [Sulfitobacter sp. 20_GPM-1509m]